MEYAFETTARIAEYFEKNNITFTVESDDALYSHEDILLKDVEVTTGPAVTLRFRSVHLLDHVSALVSIGNVPDNKKYRFYEAFNFLNLIFDHVKFFADPKGNIIMKYDFPACISGSCIGEAAIEIVSIFKAFVSPARKIFMDVLNSDNPIDVEFDEVVLSVVKKLNKMLEDCLRKLEVFR